jgi:hypothetical protein
METNRTLFIPSDILSSDFPIETKCVLAVERQYPALSHTQHAQILGMPIRAFYRYKQKSKNTVKNDTKNTVKYDTINTVKIDTIKKATSSSQINDKQKDKKKIVKKNTVKNDTKNTVKIDTKNTVKYDTIKHTPEEKARAMEYCLDLIGRINTEDDYNENREKILKIFDRTDMFTQSELDMFDEKLSMKVSKFQ